MLIEREREREREREMNYWCSRIRFDGVFFNLFFIFLMWWSDNWENINLQKEGKEKEKEKSIIG